MLLKYLKLGFVYSIDFLVFSGLITTLTFLLLIQLGTSTITILIWFKIITTIIGIIVHNKRKSKEYFFYMNIGLGKRELITYAITMDIVIWIIGFTIIIKLLQ